MLSSTSPIDRPSLHPGTRYLIAPRVPHGLASVVEGLTREVLRHRPEDIYIFAAHHFEKLLKLREQYYAEEYSGREFDHDFGCDFKLWPTKKAKDIGRSTNSDWSLEKEIEIFERRGKVSADVEESTDVSTDRENRKTSKQTCTRSLSTSKKSSKKSKDNETTSDIRATRIISQMSVLPGKNIQTKDIKQELRRNKLSGEKARATDNTEKGIRNERRSRMRISKTDKDPEEDIERTTTTTSSSRTSARRPLRKVRRIETESETETETISGETMAKTGHENGSSTKNNGANSETITRIENREKRPEAQFSEHSSKRKVSSRALSMDRIRAYVLRKFASSASLEVLRSPTYVEQVQEVIDRAAPIIKEKLEEVRGSRGKRSRSVDLAWNKEFFRQRSRDGKKRDYEKEEESKGKIENELPEYKIDTIKKEETENHLEKDEMISNVETEEKKSRRRSGGSGKKARKRENGGDVGVVDQINGKHSDKLEYESGATHDTLEAKLTATQNILEDISKSTYDLGGGRKNDSAGGELPESEISDHANVVSLPIVRPPSSRNSRSSIKNGSDSLILPPISPEAPKSTKKKDELSLPVLPVATNGNHSRKSQDAEEASTMHDITNDIEDIAILPEDQEVIVDTKEDLDTDLISSTVSDVIDAEEREKDKDTDDVLLENIPEQFIEKCDSLEEYEELERKKMEEIFKDSLNVTPEVVDMPPRPDSLEPDEEKKLQNDDVDLARVNTFDELKDKLIEIEMAERSIEIALAGQQLVMHDAGEETSQAEKSMIDGKINDVGKLADEMEETVSEIEKSADAEKISTDKDDEEKKRNDEEGKHTTNEIEEVKDVIEISMNEKENLLNITEKSEDEVKEEIERSSNEMKNTTNEAETSVNKIEKSSDKLNETEISTNEVEVTNQEEILTKAAEDLIKVSEDETSTDENERSINEKSPTDVEKLTVKIQTEDAQSIDLKSQNNDDQSQAAVCETDDDNVTASNNKADNTVNEFSKTVACESAANETEISATDLPDENTAKTTKARKKREIDSCPTTSLSLELPFSYVLSEGSPCEIPDSVTTVIIPDRHYSSPATLEDENYQFESINEKESFNTDSNIAEKSETQENKNGMEIFGEYIQPEVDILPDIDFMHSTRGVKSNQIIIAHQDLDKIKEEGEEEETKDVEKEETETPREQKDDTQPIIQEETKPVILEGIVEHEENEETSMKMTSESKDAEEISCKISKYDSSDTVELMADTDLIDEENMNLAVESRDTMENSSEENGSTQDTHTITSSDVKESTVSNQSIESPSLDRPIVPELNLDSLQDNTVSSFKMTANGTVTKENNDSPRESDTTTSLIEPLISDERLMNQPTLADREEDIAAEELMESLRSEVPEADQLYQAEHAEYEWLEKDPSSMETNLEDEVKSQENSIGLKALPEDVVVVGPLLRDEEMEKKIDNEEEIARELIGSLEEDMQLYGKALEEKSKENGESEKSSLNMNDKLNQSLLESVDEQEKGEHEISSEEIQTLDKITRTETINELSSQMEKIKQDSEDKNIVLVDNETEELKLQVEEKDGTEIAHVAPLAQFEQELLELNDTQIIKTDEEKITVENKLDTDTVSTDNQENLENSQTNIEEVIESQNDENINKIEELHEQQEKSEEEVKDREECEPEKLEVEEKEEQEKLEIDKECQQEQSEKCTQEDLKIEETDNHENLQLEENIVDIKTIPLVATESRKGSINESTNNDEGETEPIICDEFIIDDETEKETKNNEIEKSEDLSAKIQNHEPISEQSTKDHFHGGYWITETKSSTVETVIGTSTSNEGMEPDADVPEIIQDESLIQEKDDFHSAVVKIQACLRGFLMRRRMKEDAISKSVSNNISSAQKVDIDDHLTVPYSSSSREVKTGRQRLRREEALRNTTLSLENAFATGRLQHTGEFHDSVPLALFDPIYRKDNSTTSDEFLNKTIEEDAEQTNQSDIAKSNANENNSVHDDKHGGSFQKGNIFTDHSTIPIVMHLLADASRNCHFTVSQNSRPDFNTNAGGAKPVEPTLTDILMLGYPRDDENRYLNFITSVEDLGCNMDSLSLNNTIKCSKNIDDAHPSTTSGEGSIREPLALPGTPQGVVIEEVTSLETELVPSESATKPSITSKTSLDTNSSVPSEECTLEDEKNDLGTSPRIVDAMEDRKHVDGETEKQKSDCKHLESISEDDSHSEDAKKESSEVSCDNHERVEEEKNEKT